jgi:required for meiotic nuclear division protein 1
MSRMAVLPALAYGFASTFKMRDLARCFAGADVKLAKSQIVADYGDDRFAVGFDFGAVVFVNLSAEERTRILGLILEDAAGDEPHPPLEEDFLIEVRDGASPIVRFDRVIVPQLDAATLDVISLLLAQSVCIDYYEEDLQEIIANLGRRTDKMARSGRLPGSERDLVKFVGSSIATKNQIIAALAVLDKPAVTWEAEQLDRLFRELRVMLEIDERFKALEYKLRMIQETLELYLDLSHTRRSFILEATIVILIVIELAVALLGKH